MLEASTITVCPYWVLCVLFESNFSVLCVEWTVCVFGKFTILQYAPISYALVSFCWYKTFLFFFFFFVEVNLCVLKQLSLVLSLFVWRFLCVLLFSLWIQYFCGYNYFFVLIPMLFLFEVTNLCALTVFILRYIPGWRSQQFYFLVDLFRLF